MIQPSNLCTEILGSHQRRGNGAGCNPGLINLGNHPDEHGDFDFDKLAETVLKVRQLDRVIDLNFYPIESCAARQPALAPGGLGCMGLQDVFFRKRLPFDSSGTCAVGEDCRGNLLPRAGNLVQNWRRSAGRHASFADTRSASVVAVSM